MECEASQQDGGRRNGRWNSDVSASFASGIFEMSKNPIITIREIHRGCNTALVGLESDRSEYYRAYRAKHKRRYASLLRSWRAKNPNYAKQYRADNHAELSKRIREYYRKNKVVRLRYTREWVKKNPERAKARVLAWRLLNPEKVRASQNRSRIRRSAKIRIWAAKYRQSNRDRINAVARRSYARRKATDPLRFRNYQRSNYRRNRFTILAASREGLPLWAISVASRQAAERAYLAAKTRKAFQMLNAAAQISKLRP